MLSKEDKELSGKIMKGARLALDRLIVETAKEDGYLVFSKNGKIVKVKARKLLKEQKKKENFNPSPSKYKLP